MYRDKITPNNVKLRDWISVGVRDAVVCHLYVNEPDKVEVIYLDRNRAIAEDAHYVDEKWSFVFKEPCGIYADNSSRLGEFVSILRAGRWR